MLQDFSNIEGISIGGILTFYKYRCFRIKSPKNLLLFDNIL